MALTQLDPWSEVRRLQRQMDNLFEDTLGGRELMAGGRSEPRLQLWAPRMDVSQTPSALKVTAELPGMRKEDINITVQGGMLVLSGETKHEKKEENERYHRIERSYGKFSRTVPLPKDAEPNKIKACFNNGLLELEVPLPEQKQAQSQRIPIQ